MARIFRKNGDPPPPASLFRGLPALASLIPPDSNEKEKAGLILRLLRQAALGTRAAQSQAFYSIRAVATHFSVPPTTVTRLYGLLKEEGVLGTIWGSKTVVEPVEINKEIRIKAIVGLPASFRAFAAMRNYRMFFVSMQDMLWRCGFGTRLVFYEDDAADCPKIADTLLGHKVDFVIWLEPRFKISNAIQRLNDRDIRSIAIVDGMPTNGDSGYYLSRRDALIEGLIAWRRSGIRSVQLVRDSNNGDSSKQRMVEECLLDAGILFSNGNVAKRVANRDSSAPQGGNMGIIFVSGEAVLQLVPEGFQGFVARLKDRRVMFMDGAVDLAGYQSSVSSFDTIEFDWRTIARRIGSDLVAGKRPAEARRIFEARWRNGFRDSGSH